MTGTLTIQPDKLVVLPDSECDMLPIAVQVHDGEAVLSLQLSLAQAARLVADLADELRNVFEERGRKGFARDWLHVAACAHQLKLPTEIASVGVTI